MSDLCRACGILRQQMGEELAEHFGSGDVRMIEMRMVSGPNIVHAGSIALAPGMIFTQQFPLGSELVVGEVHIMMH